MHGSFTQIPVTSGLGCWQVRPGAHTGGGAEMLPPHGPPSPDTHAQAGPAAVGDVSQLDLNGQSPPHVGAERLPHGGSVVVVVVSHAARATCAPRRKTAPVSRTVALCMVHLDGKLPYRRRGGGCKPSRSWPFSQRVECGRRPSAWTPPPSREWKR